MAPDSDVCLVTADLAAPLDARGELVNVLWRINGVASSDSVRAPNAAANLLPILDVVVVVVVGALVLVVVVTVFCVDFRLRRHDELRHDERRDSEKARISRITLRVRGLASSAGSVDSAVDDAFESSRDTPLDGMEISYKFSDIFKCSL